MSINLYGFFIALGVLAGCLVVEYLRKKSSLLFTVYCLPSVFNILPYILIPGIIGARIYHVMDYWKYYAENPRQIFLVWEGGMGIFGGILGAIVGLWIFVKLKTKNQKPKTHIENSKRRIDKKLDIDNFVNDYFLSLLDLGVIGLSIGQVIGRWGNYFNQELYGLPTNLPWAIYIGLENRLPGFENFTHFHPLFLYESIGCCLIFLILIKKISILNIKNQILKIHIKNQKHLRKGELFFLYLFFYSFMRFFLEFLRIEGWIWRTIRVNQIVTLGAMLISGLAIYKKSVKIKT